MVVGRGRNQIDTDRSGNIFLPTDPTTIKVIESYDTATPVRVTTLQNFAGQLGIRIDG